MSSRSFAPRVVLAHLRQYTSRNGNTYFTGFMGKTKLVLLQDRDAECTGAEVARWTLHVEEAPPAEERSPAAQRLPTEVTSGQLALPAPAVHSPAPPRPPGRKPSDRRATELLRERGLDPDAPIIEDNL